MTNWADLEAQYYMRTFNRLPVVLDHGQGSRVWDVDGKSYLDLVAGIAVNALGHNHPALVKAIAEQAAKLIHVSNLYYSTPQLELAKLIAENSVGDRTFFANSGAEANEGAIKLARKWGKQQKGGAHEIVTVSGAFHGRTIAALDATGNYKYMKDFTPMPGGFVHVEFNDVAALEAAVNDHTAAVMLEVIQGESGVNIATDEYLKTARALCDRHNALLVLDEVQTGIGRTGTFLGYQGTSITPDVFTLAKGLAGGVPIGAIVATERAAVFTPGDHGSTFGGNPLACAAGVAVVNTVLGGGFLESVNSVGGHLLNGLNGLVAKRGLAASARGRGLMCALDLDADQASNVQSLALKKGLIVNATGPRSQGGATGAAVPATSCRPTLPHDSTTSDSPPTCAIDTLGTKVPEDKRRRRDVLEELVRSGRFRTQEDLAEELTRRGLPATAATVSRDLKALGYVKSVGGGAYTLPTPVSATAMAAPAPVLNSGSEALLRRLLIDLPLEVDQAGHLMVLKTLPGSAHTLAAPLDACRWPEVVGTVAGDDTIFIALRDPAMGETFRQRLSQLRSSGHLTALG